MTSTSCAGNCTSNSRSRLSGPGSRSTDQRAGKTRTVPLPDAVAAELAEHLRLHPASGDDLVFASREGKPINRNHFNPYTWKAELSGVLAGFL